jgi:lipoprotein
VFDFRRRVAVGVAVVLGLSGCGVSSDGVSPSPSVSWEERNTPDIVTIAVPDGWEVLKPGEIPGISRLVLVSDREPRGQEGISIGNFSPKIVGGHGPDVDVKRERDYGVEHGTAQENLVGRGIPLEPRLIAGVKAWGYAATATFGEENTYPIQRWFLWREDGEWLISVAGFANTSVIPAELIGALDTISFIRPSGTPAAPYTVTTASPSPSPGATES